MASNHNYCKEKERIYEARCTTHPNGNQGHCTDTSGDRAGTRIRIDSTRRQQGELNVLHNKVVLSFAGKRSPTRAKEWIAAFNATGLPKLLYHEQLVNDLHVVVIEDDAQNKNKATLLALPIVKAGDTFATVNDYPATFDPQNPTNFCYLTNIIIQKGSPTFFKYLDDVLESFGKVVDREIGSGVNLHRIVAH